MKLQLPKARKRRVTRPKVGGTGTGWSGAEKYYDPFADSRALKERAKDRERSIKEKHPQRAAQQRRTMLALTSNQFQDQSRRAIRHDRYNTEVSQQNKHNEQNQQKTTTLNRNTQKSTVSRPRSLLTKSNESNGMFPRIVSKSVRQNAAQDDYNNPQLKGHPFVSPPIKKPLQPRSYKSQLPSTTRFARNTH